MASTLPPPATSSILRSSVTMALSWWTNPDDTRRPANPDTSGPGSCTSHWCAGAVRTGPVRDRNTRRFTRPSPPLSTTATSTVPRWFQGAISTGSRSGSSACSSLVSEAGGPPGDCDSPVASWLSSPGSLNHSNSAGIRSTRAQCTRVSRSRIGASVSIRLVWGCRSPSHWPSRVWEMPLGRRPRSGKGACGRRERRGSGRTGVLGCRQPNACRSGSSGAVLVAIPRFPFDPHRFRTSLTGRHRP
jgi:hypothetical protein